jgi:hypothetical protein
MNIIANVIRPDGLFINSLYLPSRITGRHARLSLIILG